MRARGRATALAAVLAALALAATGCGGGDDESSDAGATTTITETEPVVTEEEAEETTETEAGGGAIADKECIELASVGAKISEAFGATGQSENLDTTTKFFEELVDKAPDEIKDDLALMATAWAEIAATLKDVDLTSAQPSAADLAKLQAVSAKFDTPELQQASKNLEAWAKEHCGAETP